MRTQVRQEGQCILPPGPTFLWGPSTHLLHPRVPTTVTNWLQVSGSFPSSGAHSPHICGTVASFNQRGARGRGSECGCTQRRHGWVPHQGHGHLRELQGTESFSQLNPWAWRRMGLACILLSDLYALPPTFPSSGCSSFCTPGLLLTPTESRLFLSELQTALTQVGGSTGSGASGVGRNLQDDGPRKKNDNVKGTGSEEKTGPG